MSCRFEALNPRAMVLLSMVDDSLIQLCYTKEKELSAIDCSTSPHRPLHDMEGALQEACVWRASVIPDDIDILVVFGIGMGWHWQALAPWLDRRASRRVIVVEDSLPILSRFIETPMAHHLLTHPQSTLLFLDDQEKKQVIDIIAWNGYAKKIAVVGSPSYLRDRLHDVQTFTKEVLVHHVEVSTVISEYMTFGERALRNFGKNIHHWFSSLQGADLFNCFQGLPACIVGAGPSLDTAIPVLQKTSSHLVLSGGSSMGALVQGGVMAHFGATVDPYGPQYSRMRQIQPFCLPILYRSRALYEGILGQRGPLLYLRGGVGYPIVEWIEEECGLQGDILDGGHSVANGLIASAIAFGCNPIVLVGYDVSYSGDQRYAQSVYEVLGRGEKLTRPHKAQASVVSTSNAGHDIYTSLEWLVEAAWISKMAQQHPDIQFINTSEHGLAIENVPYQSLDSVIATYQERDVAGLMNRALQQVSSLPVSPEKVSAALQKISHSFTVCSKLLHTLEDMLTQGVSPEDPAFLQLEDSLQREPAFEKALSSFAAMHKKLWTLKRVLEPTQSEEGFTTQYLMDKCAFLVNGCDAHQKMLFAAASWSAFNGKILPGCALPIPEDMYAVPI